MKLRLLANMVYYFVKLLDITYRYKFIGLDQKEEAKSKNSEGTYLYALWHQNLIAAIFSHLHEKFTMVISESKDGELVAVTCEKFGHLPARGSSTRGGQKALMEIIRNVKKGYPCALTVDGPTGPAKEVKYGIIEIAKLTQTAILPLSPYSENCWILKNSWDQFRIPKPFSLIVIVIGQPILIQRDFPKENYDQLALQIKNQIDHGEVLARKFLTI